MQLGGRSSVKVRMELKVAIVCLHTVVDYDGVGRRTGRYEKSCVTVWRANFLFFEM